MATRRTLLMLPPDIVIEIVGLVAATSLHLMDDLCRLGATCQAMRAACNERVVGSRVALECEESIRWFDHNRYLTLVDKLVAADYPDACFVLGLRLVFTERLAIGTAWLKQVANASHKVAAYVLGVLHYGDKEEDLYIMQVEGEGIANECKPQASRTNRECMRCRENAINAVGEVMWRVDEMIELVPVEPLGVSCRGNGCGVAEGWTDGCVVFCSDGYAVFCSDDCRIRHE